MQTIALLLVLVVYSVSASTLLFNPSHAFDEQDIASEAGKPCCIPKQVETILVTVGPADHDRHHDDDQDIELSEDVKAIIGDVDRRRLVDMFFGGWHYDAVNTKIAVEDYQTRVTTKAIVDFQAKKLYLIRGERCKVRTFPYGFKEACIPSDARSLGAYSLGIPGKSLKLNNWLKTIQPREETDEDRGRSMLVWNGAFTKKGCMITSETVAGVWRGESVFKQSSFVNVTTGIADPSVFTPPASCNTPSNGNDEDFISNTVMSFIENFYAEE